MRRTYHRKQQRVSENKYKGIGIVPPGAQKVIAGEPGYVSLKDSLSQYQKKILKRAREANQGQNL